MSTLVALLSGEGIVVLASPGSMVGNTWRIKKSALNTYPLPARRGDDCLLVCFFFLDAVHNACCFTAGSNQEISLKYL